MGVPVAGICSGADSTDPNRPVALLFAQGYGFSLLRANGKAELVISAPTAAAETMTWSSSLKGKHITALLAWTEEGGTGSAARSRVRGVVMTKAGAPVWRLDTHYDLALASSPFDAFRLGEHGLGVNAATGTIVELPDGTRRSYEGLEARSRVDGQGWLVVHSLGGAQGWGWLEVQGGERRFLSRQLAPLGPALAPSAAYRSNVVWTEQAAVYLGEDAGRIDLYVESIDLLETFPLGLASGTSVALLSQSGEDQPIVVLVEGVPTWSFLVQDRRLVALPSLLASLGAVEVHLNDRWAVLTRDGVPHWGLDLHTGEGKSVAQEALSATRVEATESWFLGANATHPVWVLDAATGELRIPHADSKSGMSWFSSGGSVTACEGGVEVLRTGEVAAPQRHDSLAGLFVESNDGWQRIGPWLARIGTIHEVDTEADTWVIKTRDLEECEGAAPWQPVAGGLGEIRSGAMTMIVRRGSENAVTLDGSVFVRLHPTGLCAYAEGAVYDLTTWERHELTVPTEALRWIE